MKLFMFKIHKYAGEDGYQKPEEVARLKIECIDEDVAYDLCDAFGNQLPFNGFITYEEIKEGGDLP